jgi:hypothetical protein
MILFILCIIYFICFMILFILFAPRFCLYYATVFFLNYFMRLFLCPYKCNGSDDLSFGNYRVLVCLYMRVFYCLISFYLFLICWTLYSFIYLYNYYDLFTCFSLRYSFIYSSIYLFTFLNDLLICLFATPLFITHLFINQFTSLFP